jgi:membrane-associated protein
MDALLQEILSDIAEYGYPILALTVLVSSAGAPLPLTPVILVAGSLAAADSLNLALLFLLVASCSILGDTVDYALGRYLDRTIVARLASKTARARASTAAVRRYFRRWSGLTIFLTRWLFTPFSSVVSVLAGLGRFPLRRFLLFDVPGQMLSAALFLGLGYVFGVDAPKIWEYFDGIPGIVACAAVGLLLTLLGARHLLRGHREPTIAKRDDVR